MLNFWFVTDFIFSFVVADRSLCWWDNMTAKLRSVIINEKFSDTLSTKIRSYWESKDAFTLDVKQKLAIFASGRLRQLLKIGQLFKKNLIEVKLSK